jgi:metacaspase-1
MPNLRILCVHGVGYPERPGQDWSVSWQKVVTEQLKQFGYTGTPQFQAVFYDQIFKDHYHGAPVYAVAIAELLASVAWHAITDPLSHLLHRELVTRGLGEEIQSHAGVVAQWVVEKELRAECRDRILKDIASFNPAIICAHSLGTLLCYDLFTHDKAGRAAIGGRTFISCGSQIANPFVKAKAWAGRVDMIDAKFWYHLYNPNDPVFTAGINVTDPKFRQTVTRFGSWPFDISAHAVTFENNHNGYLDHPNAGDVVWRSVAATETGDAAAKVISRGFHISEETLRPPSRRALLIGVNDYPDPANRLEGCVNDVFLISALLQESGFAPEDIRVVLNERATRDGIMDRLHWLLDDAQDGQERVLFYSGHGAQMPGYDVREEVDHVDECLVPYDFGWSRETAIVDKDFLELYSQLPYDARFLAIFDCCHSGGMTRDGGPKVRGLTPPDDIRHRILRWNAQEEMWEERPLGGDDPRIGANDVQQRKYVGKNDATNRLGRAVPLRKLSKTEYNRIRKMRGHCGPYLPVIFEACAEEELSYEYRDGVTTYGALTLSMTKNLRRQLRRGVQNYTQLIKATNQTLHTLQYKQTAQIVGHSQITNKPIPGGKKSAARRKR